MLPTYGNLRRHYADLRRHYVDLRRQYVDLRRHMKRQNIISIFVLNAYPSLSGSSEARKQVMKHWLALFRNDQPFRS